MQYGASLEHTYFGLSLPAKSALRAQSAPDAAVPIVAFSRRNSSFLLPYGVFFCFLGFVMLCFVMLGFSPELASNTGSLCPD